MTRQDRLDMFAAAALTGQLAGLRSDEHYVHATAAKAAFRYAEAMISESARLTAAEAAKLP